MMKFILLPAFLAVAAANETVPRTIGQPCTRGHRGILFHVSDPTNFSKGCQVTAILKKDCLQLFRGNKQTARIDLDAIETPIHIIPYHENCLSIQPGGRNAEILCCDSEACKDAWWMALSEQILCRHRGAMRNEVAGEPTEEEEERQVLERVVETPKERGTTLKIKKSDDGIEPVLYMAPAFQQIHPHPSRS